MASNTLSILKPSVNNLTARIFVRAAALDFDGYADELGVDAEAGRQIIAEHFASA